MAKAGKTLKVNEDALELIVTKGYNIAFGARFLKRMIDEQIKLPISARWKEGSHFIVKAVEGEIVVESALSSVADVIEFGDVAWANPTCSGSCPSQLILRGFASLRLPSP
jgi:hypothetical protein